MGINQRRNQRRLYLRPDEKLPCSKLRLMRNSCMMILKLTNGLLLLDGPVQPPLYLPITQPVHPANSELDAIRSVIQESERVLEKFQKQEDNMVQQVTERAKDLRDKEFKLPYQKPMPCLVDYNACRACYKEHADDILKCAPLTKSYYECVRRAKQQQNSADK
ncbi:hypothetical protein OIU74_014678 [Salix koriyanagi]|uniref:Uncharacterized protein n=1 Tax=Salix koriyanagi TaxID=2511006 RepID=A0A9Q0SZN0_9ROSI|nr:hypothetical protein OIU74_014678 [Salix koriyanagi]